MKNWLRKGILYGTTLATLAGCSLDGSKAIGPEFKEDNINSVEEASNRILKNARNNSELEQRVNNALGRMDSTSSGARKPAQTQVQNFPYDTFTGDLDLDHDVDFDDFFLLADNFGSPYSFDDFFKLADNFGKTVNRRPLVHELISSNGDKADIGKEIIFTANATDPENDPLNYNWAVNGSNEKTNGREFKWKPSLEGKYEISIKVSDVPYNCESQTLMKPVVVEQTAPVLSFPAEIKFDQYIEGQENGNIYRLALDDYVKDENEVNLSFNVLDNTFEHTKENTAPFNLRLYRPYTAKALHLELDENVLVINPVANYNANDHGTRKIVIEAKDKLNGKVGMDTVDVNVVRIPVSKDLSDVRGFANHYNNVTTGWRFKVKPREFYIWTGNIESEVGEWFFDNDLKGPSMTQAQIEKFERLAQAIKNSDNFFDQMEVKYTDKRGDYLSLYNNRDSDNPVIFCIGSNYDSSTGGRKDENGEYTLIEISVEPEKNFNTYLHEGTHAVGFDHPGIYTSGEEQFTVFSSGSQLTEIPPLDLAVIRAFYETKKY